MHELHGLQCCKTQVAVIELPCMDMDRFAHLAVGPGASRRHRANQSRAIMPTRRNTAAGPALCATMGRTSIAAAEPKYMPDVVKDTAFALSAGGMTYKQVYVESCIIYPVQLYGRSFSAHAW